MVHKKAWIPLSPLSLMKQVPEYAWATEEGLHVTAEYQAVHIKEPDAEVKLKTCWVHEIHSK